MAARKGRVPPQLKGHPKFAKGGGKTAGKPPSQRGKSSRK